MRLVDLAFACYIYAPMARYDVSFLAFMKVTSPGLDLENRAHRTALLVWLSKWGCRHIATDDYERASAELLKWCRKNGSEVLKMNNDLLQLTDTEIPIIDSAFISLLSIVITESRKRKKGNDSIVHIGSTAASKILFALKPKLFLPWDKMIREELATSKGILSYGEFLQIAKGHLTQIGIECVGRGISLDSLPILLDRPNSTLAKMIDEYFWVTITKGCKPPLDDKLNQWYLWLKPLKN